MNDFWSFDPLTYSWQFEGGFARSWKKPLPNATDQRFAGNGRGHHGVLGVGSDQNLPGADHAGYFWGRAMDGKLWLMGGVIQSQFAELLPPAICYVLAALCFLHTC